MAKFYDDTGLDESGQELLSKFNSASLMNMRLHELWQLTNTHARKGHYSEWSAILDRLWCELASDVKPDGNEEKEFVKIDLELGKIGVANFAKKGFNKLSDDDKKNMAKLRNALTKKEIFLRRLQNSQGKGTAYQDDTDMDWE